MLINRTRFKVDAILLLKFDDSSSFSSSSSSRDKHDVESRSRSFNIPSVYLKFKGTTRVRNNISISTRKIGSSEFFSLNRCFVQRGGLSLIPEVE